MISSFADRKIYSPSWTLQNVTHTQLLNLHPGTLYAIKITSMSDYGSGGFAIYEAQTEIGLPEPEPEEPTIVEHKDNTIKIKIEPAINDNGPITYYRVIVHFVENGVLQDFNSSLLFDYREAQEKGLTFYIAADLPPENTTRTFVVGDGGMYQGFYNAPLPSNAHPHISIGVVSQLNDITKIRYAPTTHEQHEHISTLANDDEGQSTLVTVLTVACILFAIILAGTIAAYFYIRRRVSKTTRLQRLSNSHEMSMHGPIVEMENSGYVHDVSDQTFQQGLNLLLQKLVESQKLPRNSLTLDIDNIIGQGEFGDVIRGSLHRDDVSFPCQVHIISGKFEEY